MNRRCSEIKGISHIRGKKTKNSSGRKTSTRMDGKRYFKYWKGMWENGMAELWIGRQANQHLWKYMDLLRSEENQDGVFFVPFCGNALDLNLMYQKGFRVVGVEWYEPAIKRFFKETNLQFVTKEETAGGERFTEYSTPDGRLRILNGDFFKISPEMLGGPVTAVWDRGAMGSVDKKLRKPYVRKMISLLQPGTAVLLDCFQYNDWYVDMAPRNFPQELIEELLEPEFAVEYLESEPTYFDEFMDVPARRSLYLLVKK